MAETSPLEANVDPEISGFVISLFALILILVAAIFPLSRETKFLCLLFGSMMLLTLVLVGFLT